MGVWAVHALPMDGIAARAAEAFARTLDDLRTQEHAADIGDPTEFGRRAALLALADTVWERQIGPLLDGRGVQRLLGVGTRQALADLVRRRRLLALDTRSRGRRYPTFQFAGSGRPYPVVPEVIGALSGAGLDAHTIAAWFTSPQRALGGRTPAGWLGTGGDPLSVAQAAKRTAARVG